MTLEEAIERTVRENAEPLARRMGIAAGEINRLLARFRSDGSNDTAGPREVVVAQFQDAMRNQIDTVYKCFVDVEATQERLRLASATLDKWERLLNATGSVVEQGARPGTDVEPHQSRAGSCPLEARRRENIAYAGQSGPVFRAQSARGWA